MISSPRVDVMYITIGLVRVDNSNIYLYIFHDNDL